MSAKIAVTDGPAHHDGENTLLHLSSVLGTKDDHLHALEVDLDGSRGSHAGGEPIGWELASVVDDEVWLAKVLKLGLRRSDKHVVHEEGVVGTCADDPDLDAVLGIPLRKTRTTSALGEDNTSDNAHSGITVKDVDEFTGVKIVDGTLAIDFESVWGIGVNVERGRVKENEAHARPS